MRSLDPNTLPQVLPPDAEPWRADLLRAAAYMDVHGKCEFMQKDREGRVCAAGAISIVTTGTHDMNHDPRCEAVATPFVGWLINRGLLPKDAVGPARWNNRPDVDKETVVTAMRRCALEG